MSDRRVRRPSTACPDGTVQVERRRSATRLGQQDFHALLRRASGAHHRRGGPPLLAKYAGGICQEASGERTSHLRHYNRFHRVDNDTRFHRVDNVARPTPSRGTGGNLLVDVGCRTSSAALSRPRGAVPVTRATGSCASRRRENATTASRGPPARCRRAPGSSAHRERLVPKRATTQPIRMFTWPPPMGSPAPWSRRCQWD